MLDREITDAEGTRWAVRTSMMGFAARAEGDRPPEPTPWITFTSLRDGTVFRGGSSKPGDTMSDQELLTLLERIRRRA